MEDSIKRLQKLFSRFPTIGSRTASRFVFYLLSLPTDQVKELITAIAELKNKVRFCSFCFNPHENEGKLCSICHNPAKNRQLLCVVEKEPDLLSIDKSGRYNGLYFILGGALNLRQSNLEHLRVKDLITRLQNPAQFSLEKADFKEIIIAVNSTPEGKSTSLLIERSIKEVFPTLPFKITHLAQGIPVGGELEYADEDTLGSAFEGRK